MNYGIGNVKAKSSGGGGGNVWHTWTQANFIDGEATFSISNIVKPNDIPLSVADKVLYVDENDNIVECYMIDTIGDISVTLVKVGDFSSGGGGIPVITLQASQMVDQTHIQFTEEQYNTIVNNGCFYLDLLGSQQLLMTCVNASNLADIQCYNISQTGSGLQLATIDLNKTTYIGVLGVSPYPQATPQYTHNICLANASDGFKLFLQITNNVSAKYTSPSAVFAYIYSKGFVWEEGITYQKKLFGCSGWVFNTSNEFIQVDCFIMTSATQIKAYGFKGSTTKADLNVNTSTFTICEDTM